jgi:gas vesicle protein
MRGNSKTQLAGFFLTGAAIGAAATLIFAPKSGAQTRKDIRKFSKRTMDQIDDLQGDIREQIVEVFDNVKDYVEDGKERLQKLIKTA